VLPGLDLKHIEFELQVVVGVCKQVDTRFTKDVMNSNIWVSATSEAFKKNSIERSKEQRVVYYNGEGLIVCAFDYGFQLVTKLDKMSKNPGREVDAEDAVLFLRRYRNRHGTLSIQQLKDLYPYDGGVPRIDDPALEALTKAWKNTYDWDEYPEWLHSPFVG
jgi:hypothetical protein